MREVPYTSNCLLLPKTFKFYCTYWSSFFAEAYSGLQQISEIESLATIVYRFYPLTIVAKLSILDVCGSPGYASEFGKAVTVEDA